MKIENIQNTTIITIDDIIDRTFTIDNNISTLPTIKELKEVIVSDDWNNVKIILDSVSSSYINRFSVRDNYIIHSFLILNHEFLLSIKKMVSDLNIKKISELSCGIGWFSYWLNKYNISIIDSVDNYSWKFKTKINNWVTKQDSKEYVKNNQDLDMFILSWPYMDNVADNIWKSMKQGQYLLYIGEGYGGCTADDKFHELVEYNKIKDSWGLQNNFISFYAIHDYPVLYRKN